MAVTVAILIGATLLIVFAMAQAAGGSGGDSSGGGSRPPAALPPDPLTPSLAGTSAPYTWDNQILYAVGDPAAFGNVFGNDSLAPYMVKAIIKWESNFSERQQTAEPNGTTSYGLMHVNSVHGFSVPDLLNGNLNILRGCEILARCYEDNSGDWQSALTCYNGSGEYPPHIFAIVQGWGVAV